MNYTPPPEDRCSPPERTLSERLRRLASRVERLAVSGRTDPENVLIEKQQIGRALRRLASEVP